MDIHANEFPFEDRLNNRIVDINNRILNNPPPRVIIGNHIYYNENGVSSSVPFSMPNNWVTIYENEPNNNFNTIRICYEYFLISYYRDMGRMVAYLNTLNQIGEENINDGGNEMNNVRNTLNTITNSILEIGNIYLGILLEHENN
tara:strand:+ start:11 stop:445 length:435 start_codon:yes stop_codon:yes gene_type:complete